MVYYDNKAYSMIYVHSYHFGNKAHKSHNEYFILKTI